jgi:hypothetical protein
MYDNSQQPAYRNLHGSWGMHDRKRAVVFLRPSFQDSPFLYPAFAILTGVLKSMYLPRPPLAPMALERAVGGGNAVKAPPPPREITPPPPSPRRDGIAGVPKDSDPSEPRGLVPGWIWGFVPWLRPEHAQEPVRSVWRAALTLAYNKIVGIGRFQQ